MLALLLAGCATAHPVSAPVPALAADDIRVTLLLIGDAGKPAVGGDPVLQALTRTAAEAPARTTVVFLGDNVYPRGIPDSASPERAEMERRLRDQVAAVRAAGAPAVFIPGNHDWAKHADDGWNAIRRQEALLAADGGPVVLLPGRGCPGPAVLDIGDRVRLVLLDTQWWLHHGPKPEPPDTTCVADTPARVVDSLRAALASAGDRAVIVAGHHPLESAGPHGGRFTVADHLFPLRVIKSWLWLPLPIIGSIYPVSRMLGVSSQDMSAGANERMRAAIEESFAPRPPLVYVSGHEHALQVFEPEAQPFILVSGAGIVEHESAVGWRKDTRYASSSPGFMRLDALADGRVRLGVWTVSEKGEIAEAFSTWLAKSAP